MKTFNSQIIISILYLFAATSFSGDFSMITNVDHRDTINLNGEWRIIIDPYETGYYNYRYQPNPNGWFKNEKHQNKSDLIEYNFDESPILNVPGDWNTQLPELLYYEGSVWYKKSFDYKTKEDKRVFLHFGAANYHARVWLNGEALGEHKGGFTPFQFEITDKVHNGENFIVAQVNNKRHLDAVPTVNTDWWNYGGLTRRVLLIETPETFIRDSFIQLKKGSRNEISGWVQLDGKKLKQKVRFEIPEAGISHAFETNDEGKGEYSIKASLTLWSPEVPKLYRVIVSTETDKLEDEIGFRSIETRGTDILLNDKSIFLRGISIHEEAPVRTGRAYSLEDARTLLGWARDLGCNFVRLAHYPHNELMVREADRMGMIVWSEIPVYWTIQWDNQETIACAEQQLSEMIIRDKNRACIALWSVGNEAPPTEERLNFMRSLVDRARMLDPTRLITAALERHGSDPKTFVIDDPLGNYLDVLGCNEYVGWYDGPPEKALTLTWESIYEKPLIMSEFGGGALYGYHGDADERWTEEYQESIYRNQSEMLAKIPFLKGTSPWILMDFRSPRRPMPKIQDGWNRKGLISERGEQKKAFFALKKYYEELKKSDEEE